jgi:phosphoenolpyruvate-protein kinase (PTS system EI component)
MSVNLVAENKAFIRNLNYTDCVAAANYCLGLSTTFEVRQHLWDKFINVAN